VRKAIRLHPWRLEIVPAAAFALTVWSVCVYETRVAWVVQRIPELQHYGLGALPWVLLGMVLAWWLVEFGYNLSWVQSERRKRFNAYVLVLQSVVITHAWSAYAFTSVFLSMLHRHAARPAVPVSLLLALIVAGTGTTALLEWSRKYVPREEPPEPPLPADALGAPCYRELAIDWWMMPGLVVLCGIALVCLVAVIMSYAQGEHPGIGSLLRLAFIIVGAGLTVSMSRTALSVTPMAFTYWSGPVRIRLSVAEIETCVPGRRDDDERPRGVKRTSWCRRGQRCIEITMTNGRVYRLGALRPTHICQLVEQARKDLPPAPSAAAGEKEADS
jgi:hypothetical protein